MSQHTPSSRPSRAVGLAIPRGRAGLVALEVALGLAGSIATLEIPRGLSHVRDHLVRACDNAALRLSEASGRTLGNRRQHLEAAYAEVQEVQTALALIAGRGIEVPGNVFAGADRLGGLVHGLLRAESRA